MQDLDKRGCIGSSPSNLGKEQAGLQAPSGARLE